MDRKEIQIKNSCIAMTTKEIADLTGKRHDHVIRDTENMLNELGICLPKFGGTYKSAQGKDVKCYILPKDLTLTLVSGYSIKMRKAIIDRWTELESQGHKRPEELTRIEILQIAIEAEQERKILEANLETAKNKIETLEPMAEYGHKIFNSENLYTATNIGQMIGVSAMILNRHLKRLHVIRKGTGKYTDYELCMRYANYGLIKYNETPGYSTSTGKQITHRSLRWTRRGYDWLVGHKELIVDGNRKSLPLPKLEVIKAGA